MDDGFHVSSFLFISTTGQHLDAACAALLALQLPGGLVALAQRAAVEVTVVAALVREAVAVRVLAGSHPALEALLAELGPRQSVPGRGGTRRGGGWG